MKSLEKIKYFCNEDLIMSIRLEIEKKQQIEEIQRRFKKNLSEKVILNATASAINRALSRSIPKINKSVRAKYNINAKYLKRIAYVCEKAKPTSLYGTLGLSPHPVPIIGFRPKQTKEGIAVSVKKGSRKLIRKGFIATMKSGHTGVFARGIYGKGRLGFVFGNFINSKGKIAVNEINTASPFAMGLNRAVAKEVREFMDQEVVKVTEGILKSRVEKLGKR